MKKMLVTGGTTFVSKYVATYFRNTFDVYVLNRNTKPQVNGVKLMEADRHNLGTCLQGLHFDVVADITAYDDKDITDLLNALESFDRYIMLSSSAVYPETARQPFTEEAALDKNKIWGKYGTDKIAAENALLKRCPDALIIRPPYLYGPMNNVYREAFVFECAQKNREFYIPGNGEMKLQFFYVSDLCKLIEVLVSQNITEHILNVGNPDPISVKDWVTLCYKCLGKTPVFHFVYDTMDQRNYFSFYDYEYCLDVTRQCKILPVTTDLYAGLAESFEWYQHNTNQVKTKPFISYIDTHFV